MIQYKVGNLFELYPKEVMDDLFIPHICNNVGGWGSGFVVPLAKQWPETRQAYISLPNYKLGETQFVRVTGKPSDYPAPGGNIWVCNMIAQNHTISPENPKPIKYAALAQCMQRVAEACRQKTSPEIHAPMFGSGLAGGNWDFIEELIQEIWNGIPTTIYKLE